MRIGRLGLLVTCLAAPLEAQSPSTVVDIDEAFRLAGVRTMLDALPSRVAKMAATVVTQLPKDKRQPFEPLVKDESLNFGNPDGFYRQLRTYFVKHYDADKLATFLALERTPTYRTLRRLEVAAETSASEAGRLRFEANLKSDPAAGKRVDILRRLDEALNTTGLEVRLAVTIVNAMADSLGPQLPAGLDNKSAEFTTKVQSALANNVLVYNLHMYRNSDDADLEDYVAIAQQPAEQWFHRNLQDAILGAAVERVARPGADVKAIVTPRIN